MQFPATTLLAFTLAALTSAADIRGFTGSSCQTRAIACLGIKEGRCCNFGSSPVNSVSWTLPASSRGFGYIGNNNCAINRRDDEVVRGKKTRFCQRYQTSCKFPAVIFLKIQQILIWLRSGLSQMGRGRRGEADATAQLPQRGGGGGV